MQYESEHGRTKRQQLRRQGARAKALPACATQPSCRKAVLVWSTR